MQEVFDSEPYSFALASEMMPLMVEHFKETKVLDGITFNPDLQIYANLHTAGVLRIFTARISGKLVAYQVFFVMRHPHSRDSVQANQDILYVDKPYRKGWFGYRFIKYCSDKLLSDGVQVVFQRISAKHDFGPVLERMGYRLIDLTFARTAHDKYRAS